MGKIDFQALADFQNNLENIGSLYRYQKNLPPELDVRILPPQEGMPFYFIKEDVFWINGKRYLSPSTFGEDCPILDEIKEARALRDPNINKLLTNSQKFSHREEYSMCILELECEFSKGDVVNVQPVGSPKVFKCTKQMIGAINKIAINRKYQNGTDNGFCDLEEGFNITLTRQNVNGKVNYDAEAHRSSFPIPEDWVQDTPNLLELTEGNLLSNDELREAVRTYLYGSQPKTGSPQRQLVTPPVERTVPTRSSRRIEEFVDDGQDSEPNTEPDVKTQAPKKAMTLAERLNSMK